MVNGYDWATIKAEYETGKYSMRELSEKHGFNLKYALRKAKNKGWEKGSSRNEVEREAAKRVIDRIGKSEADIKQELFETLTMIESKMNQEWGNEKPNFDILKSTKISTEILQNIMDMKYELLDIQKVAKKVEQNIDANVNKLDLSDISTEDLKELIENEKEG